MQLGLIGLGKMGGNMRERLRLAGHEVIGYDINPTVSDVKSLAELVKPRGSADRVDDGGGRADHPRHRGQARRPARPGDLVIDGGNSRFTDDFENELLKAKGIGYVDCGVSGGIWGLKNGYGLMVGGTKANVKRAMPIFDALRPEGPRDEGFVHAGKVGAGHYTKMVHNGIEYGLMAAYAEGYELLARKDIVEDVPGAFKAWTRGTVVRSWLLDLLVEALEKNPTLADVSDYTVDSGEGSGPSRRRSPSTCRCRSSRPHSSPASPRASRSARRCRRSRRCGRFGGHQVMTIAEGDALRVRKAESRPRARQRRNRHRSAPRKAAAPGTKKGRRQEGCPEEDRRLRVRSRRPRRRGRRHGPARTSPPTEQISRGDTGIPVSPREICFRRRAEPPRHTLRPCTRHLTLGDFGLSACRPASGAGHHDARGAQRSGQDQFGRGHRLCRDAEQPPGGDRCAAGEVRRGQSIVRPRWFRTVASPWSSSN